MPATDSPATLCARFLRANNYRDTLQAFLTEAGLPADAGLINPGDLTIDQILEEKRIFDQSLRFEKEGISKRSQEWSSHAPAVPSVVDTLASSANLLHVSLENVGEGAKGHKRQILFASTADRRLSLLDPNDNFALLKASNDIHDSPILSCVMLNAEEMKTVTASMSGKVVLYDHRRDRVVSERRDHKKYVVRVTRFHHRESTWVATAGWDAKVILYRVKGQSASNPCSLGEPVATLSLATNPETITFITHPESGELILLVTRRDSTSLHYYLCQERCSSTTPMIELRVLGSQNLAPHSNAWITFSPSSVAICPIDPQLVAVATSTVPHMKLIIVRLLVPELQPPSSDTVGDALEPITQVSQARRKLAVEDRENMAIEVHVNTLAPQTPYSTPQVCWRPDGSGVWVNGDDGVLRGFDATTGKICSILKGGHEPGSKIRSMWAGMVDVDGNEEEWAVSGGFDKRLVVWKPSHEEGSGAR
ncbi:MAG: hypothetical protein Q9179_001336 [Wetmoreana sp. 5 TL-2023]